MERNYLEKVHQNDIKSKRDIQTTLVFNISKTYQKEILKQPQLFTFKNHIKICVTSVFHLNFNKKFTETRLIFCPAKSGRKKYIKTTLIFRSSKLRRINYVEATSIFCSPKLHRKSTSK